MIREKIDCHADNAIIFTSRALICCSLRHTTLSSTRRVVWHTCSIFRNRGFLGRSLERYFRVSHKTFTPLFFHARNQFGPVLVPILQSATVRRVSYPRRVCSVVPWRNRHTRRHFICVIGYRRVVGNLPPSCYTLSSNPLARVTAMRRHVASKLALSLYWINCWCLADLFVLCSCKRSIISSVR